MVVATVDEHGQPYQRIVLLNITTKKAWCFTPTSAAVKHTNRK